MEKLSITPDISLLLNYKFPNCNSLLIEDEKTALIDTGLGRNLLKEILNEIKIDLLINTHTHPDHVAGNRIVAEMTLPQYMCPSKNMEDLFPWKK